MEDSSSPPSTTSAPLMFFAIFPISDQDHSKPHHKRWPTTSEVVEEIQLLYNIAIPMIIAGLLLYGKSVISMLFMGRLGKEFLAGGSLSIGFANITGYSVLSGLAMGMEPISSQACGAKQFQLIGTSLQRTIAILLFSSIPITLIWLNVEPILLYCRQDPCITAVASTYLAFSLPDLIFLSILNPLKIYLRTQNITMPLTISSAIALFLHAPINYFLIFYLGLGIKGVALSNVIADFNIVAGLLVYLSFSGTHKRTWPGFAWSDCFSEWKPLLNLAIPSCVSVCLEWWWYELMILFSGLLANASEAVAAMGILIQTTSLVYIFPSALSLAVSTRVGNELGANRPEKAKLTTRVALFCAIFTGFAAMFFTTTMRKLWGQAFTTDGSIISLITMVMPIMGLCEIGNCPQTTGCGVLRGSARPSLGANINLGSFYGVGMPIAMVMGFVLDFGLLGLWLGLLAAQGTCAMVMLYMLMRTDWALQAKRATDLVCEKRIAQRVDEEKNDSLSYRLVERDEVESLISVKVVQDN